MSATPQDEPQPAKADPFARAKPPPGAITDDDEAEFGQSLAAKALAFSSMAPPLAGGASAKPAAPAPAAAAPPAPRAPPAPPAHLHEPAVRIPGSPAAASSAAESDDDEIFGGSNLAAAALKYAAQAPPRAGGAPTTPAPMPVAPSAPRRSIDEPPPLERAAPTRTPERVHGSATVANQPPPLQRSATQGSDGECRIAVSRDGFKELWDVVFPGGGGAVIVLTPRRCYPGDARVLAAHISWRAADAVATAHAASFAGVLAKAASQAETLPPATLT
jgi:hypothetical protein